MISYKKSLFVLLFVLIQSSYAVVPATTLVFAKQGMSSLVARSGTIKIASTTGVALFITLRHYGSLQKIADSLIVRSCKEKAMARYEKMQQWWSDRFYVNSVNNSTVHNTQPGVGSTGSVMQAAKSDQGATASGFLNFPKNETHNHTTIHHNYGPKGWATNFFEWLEKGRQTRAVGVGFVAGVAGTSGVHYMLRSKFGSNLVEQQKPQVIVVQVPAATGSIAGQN